MVPKEAIDAAAESLRVSEVDETDPMGWFRGHAEAAVRASAPLIVAAAYEQLATDYAEAAEVFGNRAKWLLTNRPMADYQAGADRAVGKALALEDESSVLRRRAVVLRSDAQRSGDIHTVGISDATRGEQT